MMMCHGSRVFVHISLERGHVLLTPCNLISSIGLLFLVISSSLEYATSLIWGDHRGSQWRDLLGRLKWKKRILGNVRKIC